VKDTLRRILTRIGLTGKLLLLAGGLMTISLLLLSGIAHFRALATVHNELRKTETVRVGRWALRHAPAIQADDTWKISETLLEIGHDPYVVYAGFFDPSGRPAGHWGDESAYTRPHTLDILIPLRAESVRQGDLAGLFEGDANGPPLPGMVSDPRAAARAVPFKERFRAALEGEGSSEGSLIGWVEVTMTTAPLDALLEAQAVTLAAASAALIAAGLMMTWFFARRAAVPLQMLADHADAIGEGRRDLPFHEVPRLADEIGDLAARMSIMAGRLDRNDAMSSRGSLSLDRVAHDLRTPIASIKAFAELLEDEDGASSADRARFLENIRTEADRLEKATEELPSRLAEAMAPQRAESAGPRPEAGWDEAAADAATAEAAAREVLATARQPRGGGILVATADHALLSFAEEAFAGGPADVIEASDVKSALRLARENAPDAVIFDLHLEDGEAVASLLDFARDDRTRKIPLVPVSIVDARGAMLPGVLSCHSKPLDRERFLVAMRAALPLSVESGTRGGIGRVLVVDDDRFIVEAIRSILARDGWGVRVARSGEQALLAVREETFDAVVLDLTMPDIGGIEVMRRLRSIQTASDMPVILTTAHEIPGGEVRAWPGAGGDRRTLIEGLREALRGAAVR